MTTNATAAPTTAQLLQRATEITAALAAYTHLPALDRVSVYGSGLTYLGCEYHSSLQREMSDLCAWASAFDVSVDIELSYSGSGNAEIMFDLAGYRTRMHVLLNSAQAYELGAALHRPITPSMSKLTVTAAELMAALGGGDDG